MSKTTSGVRFKGIDWDKEALKWERRVEKTRGEEQQKRKVNPSCYDSTISFIFAFLMFDTDSIESPQAEQKVLKQKLNNRARELSFLCGFFSSMDRPTLTETVVKGNGMFFLSVVLPVSPNDSIDATIDVFESFLVSFRQGLIKFLERQQSSSSDQGTIPRSRRRGRGSLLKRLMREFYDSMEIPLNGIDLQQKLNLWFYWKCHLERLSLYTPLDRFLQYLFSTSLRTLKQAHVPHEFLRQFYGNDDGYLEQRFLERNLRASMLNEDDQKGFMEWEETLVSKGKYDRCEGSPCNEAQVEKPPLKSSPDETQINATAEPNSSGVARRERENEETFDCTTATTREELNGEQACDNTVDRDEKHRSAHSPSDSRRHIESDEVEKCTISSTSFMDKRQTSGTTSEACGSKYNDSFTDTPMSFPSTVVVAAWNGTLLGEQDRHGGIVV